jgi:PASTA domain
MGAKPSTRRTRRLWVSKRGTGEWSFAPALPISLVMRFPALLAVGFVLFCTACGGAKKQEVRVPNLVGVYHGAALDRLERAGLCVGLIKFSLKAGGPYDVVVGQKPRAGTLTPVHAPVTLTLTPNGSNGAIYSEDLPGCPLSIVGSY